MAESHSSGLMELESILAGFFGVVRPLISRNFRIPAVSDMFTL